MGRAIHATLAQRFFGCVRRLRFKNRTALERHSPSNQGDENKGGSCPQTKVYKFWRGWRDCWRGPWGKRIKREYGFTLERFSCFKYCTTPWIHPWYVQKILLKLIEKPSYYELFIFVKKIYIKYKFFANKKKLNFNYMHYM